MNLWKSTSVRIVFAALLALLAGAAPRPLAAQADFFTITPCRQYDSRGGDGPFDQGSTHDAPLTGAPCGVPANAAAVVTNVTIIAPGTGSLVVYPKGATPPSGSPPEGALSFNAGRTLAKIYLLVPGAGGQVSFNASYSNPGKYHVIIDITGYFLNQPSTVANDLATVLEDAAATPINVLANDSDPDDTLTIASATNPPNGTVALTPAGPGPYTGLTYKPAPNYCNDPPGATPDTFTYTLNTGSTGTVEVKVTCVNDAPAGTDKTVATSQATDYVFAAADFGFTDPNDTPANALLAVKITTLPALGSLKLSGSPVSAGQSIAATDITLGNLKFTPAGTGTPYTSFTFQVQDDGGTANGGVDLDPSANTLTINVNDVNDAPAGTDNTVTTNEDTDHIFAAADFGFTDPNDTPPNAFLAVKITTLPGAGSLTLSGAPFAAGTEISVADINANKLKFSPAANASGSPYASFTFQVRDDGGTTGGGIDLDASPNTLTVNVTPVNDAPAGTNNTVTTPEDTQYTFTAADFGFTDPNDTPANALLAVKVTTLPGAGSLTLLGGPIAAGQDIAVTDINAGNLKFSPAANASGSPYASFTFQVRDDGGTANGGVDLDASANTLTINVTAVNDAPTGTDNTITTLEEAQYTFTAADFGFTDPNDSPANAFQSVKITTLPGAGSLTLSGSPFAAGTEIAVADITAGNLKFSPAANGSGSPYASFTFQVRDDGGTANSGVDLDPTPNTMTINVTAVNDAPAGTDKTITAFEDTQYTFTVADFGFTDPLDSPPNALASVVITTLPGAGSLTLSGSPFAAGTEIPVASITAGNLKFLAAANASGSPYTTFTFQVRDNGGTANSGVDLDPTPNTITMNVTPVNDAPAGTDNTVTTLEDTQYTFTAADFGFSDPLDSPPNALASVVITTLPGAGSLTLSGSPFAAGTEIPVASIGNLKFLPAANAFGSPYTSFTFQVRDNGGTANGGVNLDPTPNTLTIDVTPVNDAPTLTTNPITFTTPGNTQLHVAGATLAGVASWVDAQSALAKSSPADVDGPGPLEVVAASGSSTNGGSFSIASNGSFTYVPPVGFSGTDSFSYNVTDNGAPAATVTGTVNITVGQRVWYIRDVVDVNNAAGGDGRSTNAFDSIAAFNAATTNNGDIIFVFRGNTGTTPLSGSITLKDGQKLWGEGIGLNVPGFGSLIAAGSKPRINNGSGDAVSVPATAGNRQNVEIRGLDLQASGNAVDVTASGANAVGVTISDNNVSGAGLEGIDLNAGSTGAFAATLANNALAATGNAFDARTSAASALTISFHDNAVVSNAIGVLIDGSGGGTTTITGFANNAVSGTTAGSGIVITGPATFDSDTGTAGNQTVSGGTTVIGASGNGVGGAGLVMTSVTGTLNFTDLDIFADGGAGLRATGTGGFTLQVGAGVGIIEAVGGPAVDVTSAAIDLQLTTLKSTNSATTGVSLDTVTGTFSAGSGSSITNATGTDFNINAGTANVTYNGTITDDVGQLVSVTNATGGTKSFTGAITDGGDGDGNGVSLTSNTGATISFSGGIVLSTGTNPAFTATGPGPLATSGGTVTVTGSTNTLQTTTATALNVVHTTIGAGGLNFRSISSGVAGGSGPANGINLNNTGTLGGLTVSGNGGTCTFATPTCSGGTIQSSTSDAVKLVSTQNVSLTRMRIHDNDTNGIYGDELTNFTLANSVVSDNDVTNPSAFEAGIKFNELYGTNSITDTVVRGTKGDNIRIEMSSGTLANLTLTNATVGPTANVGGGYSNGFSIVTTGSPTLNITVTNSLFTGVDSSKQQSSGILTSIGGGTTTLTVTGSDFEQENIGIDLGSSSTGTHKFNIDNNDLVFHRTNAINLVGSSVMDGTVNNNRIGNGTADSGSMNSFGIAASHRGNSTWRLALTNNTVKNTDFEGIFVRTGDLLAGDSGTVNLTLTGNTVFTPDDNSGFPANPKGMHLRSRQATTLCMNVANNEAQGNGAPGYHLQESDSSQLRFQGFNTNAVTTLTNNGNKTAGGAPTTNEVGAPFAGACTPTLPTFP